jgi:hypothetical protein
MLTVGSWFGVRVKRGHVEIVTQQSPPRERGGASAQQRHTLRARAEACAPVPHSHGGMCVLGSRGNDPSAGSPTETLLRLHLPLDGEVYSTSRAAPPQRGGLRAIRRFHRAIQSVGATGGVYKGQGRNQCKLMTCVY